MTKRIVLLAVIFTLSLSTSVLAAEPGSGMIEGQVVNRTTGGSSVANQDITLSIRRDGKRRQEQLTLVAELPHEEKEAASK